MKINLRAPERYKVQFTMSADTHAKLREVQDLIRHAIPDGDVAVIFERRPRLTFAPGVRGENIVRDARAGFACG